VVATIELLEVWNAWNRTIFEYDGFRYIGSFAPLFVHQYSQAWFDFRNKRDKYAKYFPAIWQKSHLRCPSMRQKRGVFGQPCPVDTCEDQLFSDEK
jgi:hypothetical protein